jgi:hypothetical protein
VLVGSIDSPSEGLHEKLGKNRTRIDLITMAQQNLRVPMSIMPNGGDREDDEQDPILVELLNFADRQQRGRDIRHSPSNSRRSDILRHIQRALQQRSMMATYEMDPLAVPSTREPLLGEAYELLSDLEESTEDVVPRAPRDLLDSSYDNQHAQFQLPNSDDSWEPHSLNRGPTANPIHVRYFWRVPGVWESIWRYTLTNWHKMALLAVAVAVLSFEAIEYGHGSSSEQQPDSTSERLSRFLACAKALTAAANLTDHSSPEYLAVDWLVATSDLELAPKDPCPTWESAFGTSFALYLIRHSLKVEEWDLTEGTFSICSNWKRIHCNAQQQVTHLILNNANLSGTIATEMGGLVHLESLSLISNPHLYGPLPTELGMLTALTSLQIQHTRISGELSSQLGRLMALEQLELYDTDLFGRVPGEICDLKTKGHLKHLVKTCGSVLDCECCTQCRQVNASWLD